MSKFSVRVHDPKGFARAFKLCAGITPTKSRHSNSITQVVLLTVSGFHATLQATDLSQYLTIDLGLATQGLALDGEGCLTLPNDWKVPKEPFTLESEPSETGPMVTLRFGAVTQDIPQPHNVPDEYPHFPLANAGVKFALIGTELAHHLSKLSEYTASEKGRYALNGLLWEFGGEVNQPLVNEKDSYSVQLVATDGKHLAAHALSVSTKKAPRFQSILHYTHAQNLSSIIKTLDSAEEPNVEVAFPPEVETTNDKSEITEVTPRESCMFFGNRKWTLATRFVEGQFPDWHSVVPKNDVTVLLRRQEYIDALNAVKGATSVEACAVKHTFNADHLLLEAKSRNGYARAQVSLPTVPPQMILGLDPEYLLQALDALHGEWVVFEFKSCEYGVNLHDGAPQKRYHLVMPIDVIGDQPTEPKQPEFEEKEQTWKDGAWHQLTPEEKAQAKAQHEEAMREYEKDLAAWRIELEQWRISKRMRKGADDLLDEQKAGEFFPRPAHEPAIGFTLAPAPTLEQLKEQALAAKVVEKPKAKAKAKAPVAPAPTAAPAPTRQPTESCSHEEEHLETAAQLGYGLDKNQLTFGL